MRMAYKDKGRAIKYVNDYKRDNYDRINLLVPKGEKAKIKARAEAQSKSLNQYIVDKINAPD
jgi:predicted HicB family RNase H-like nuclease